MVWPKKKEKNPLPWGSAWYTVFSVFSYHCLNSGQRVGPGRMGRGYHEQRWVRSAWGMLPRTPKPGSKVPGGSRSPQATCLLGNNPCSIFFRQFLVWQIHTEPVAKLGFGGGEQFGCTGSELQHVSSIPPAKDRTQAPCIGNSEPYPLEALGSPSHPPFVRKSPSPQRDQRPSGPAARCAAAPWRTRRRCTPSRRSPSGVEVPAARPAGTWGALAPSQGCAPRLRGDWTSWVLREQPADTPPAVD